MQHKIPSQLSKRNKAVRDDDLSAPQSLPLFKIKPVRLDATISLKDAIDSIVSNCLEQVRGNESGVVRGNDPEHIHQMRIGLRRLRLALELFKEVFPSGMALQEDMEWLSAELGTSRNWDVLAFDTLKSISKAFPEELEGLMLAAQSAAVRQRRHTALMVGSARYAQLHLKLDEWLQGMCSTDAAEPGNDKKSHQLSDVWVKKFYSHVFDRYRRKLLQRGEALDEGDFAAMHHVRISAKKLRYTLDFFQSLPSARKARPFTSALTDLLSVLGKINDASCADTLLRELAQLDPQVANEANFARGYLAFQSGENTKNIHRIWQRFCVESALKQG